LPPDHKKATLTRGIHVNQPRFPHRGEFYNDVKARVNRYFDQNRIQPTGDRQLHIKTAVIFAAAALSYAWIVFGAQSWIGGAIGCFVLAQAIALIGFNVMHDGAHGAYSSSRRINWWMAFTLDLLGGSNKMWRTSHNVSHHMFTNIDGYDVDLFSNGLLRLSPAQTRLPHHRFQLFYVFAVYALTSLWWVTTRDVEYFVFKKGQHRIRAKLTLGESALLAASKLLYYAIALGVPMAFHPTASVLLGFLLTHLAAGLTLGTVFQLAHTTEVVAFPRPTGGSMEREWAVHQVETTVDWAPNSRIAAWYCGGLNFQIEHHLFSHVSHVHYPAISRIVREACADHRIRYHSHPSFWAALKAHLRFIAAMGDGERYRGRFAPEEALAINARAAARRPRSRPVDGAHVVEPE
jgi:linoleoyl-CoA desaturase